VKSQQLHTTVAAKPLAFRHVLHAELARRCAANPRYSLRAFAKYLGIDHSTLSQLFRGKRQFTAAHIRKACVRLGFNAFDIETWQHLESQGPATESVSQEIKQLSDDIASVMNDINHYAILELTRLEGFQADSRWIARMLGITTDEVNITVQCLLRLQLLEMVSPTRWEDRLGDAMSSVNTFTQASLERYLQQLQQLMLRSITTEATGGSLIHSTTLAISSQRLPLALDMLNAFHQKFVARLSPGDKHDAVYQFHLSFLPLTSPSENAHGTARRQMADHQQEP
jgi:uncharacterized protein (TIGR02147 family)